MSKAIFCDRCKKLILEDVSRHSKIEFDRYNEAIFDGDLCNDCQDALEDFLDYKPKKSSKPKSIPCQNNTQ